MTTKIDIKTDFHTLNGSCLEDMLKCLGWREREKKVSRYLTKFKAYNTIRLQRWAATTAAAYCHCRSAKVASITDYRRPERK